MQVLNTPQQPLPALDKGSWLSFYLYQEEGLGIIRRFYELLHKESCNSWEGMAVGGEEEKWHYPSPSPRLKNTYCVF